MEFDLDVAIDRPVADVFAYVTDVRKVPEWQESAESAEWIEEGKRFRERRQFMGALPRTGPPSRRTRSNPGSTGHSAPQ